jgi:excisionase family DNA binding protein
MATADPRPLTRLLNISEVADVLNVDVRHVRRLVHERRIPYLKWGRPPPLRPHRDPGVAR